MTAVAVAVQLGMAGGTTQIAPVNRVVLIISSLMAILAFGSFFFLEFILILSAASVQLAALMAEVACFEIWDPVNIRLHTRYKTGIITEIFIADPAAMTGGTVFGHIGSFIKPVCLHQTTPGRDGNTDMALSTGTVTGTTFFMKSFHKFSGIGTIRGSLIPQTEKGEIPLLSGMQAGYMFADDIGMTTGTVFLWIF
jgi:hypothetical protein